MYFQTLDDKTECVGVYTDGRLHFEKMPENLKGQYQEYTCADITKLNRYISIENFIGIEEYLKDTLIQK